MGDKTIGILGGMGPLATADLFMKIIQCTQARKDQDHLRVVIDSNAKIPDRTAFLLGNGDDPTNMLIETAKNVEKMGADLIIIPCNTAHYFYRKIQEAVSAVVLNIMDEVAKELHGKVSTVGILASTGTVNSKLYDSCLKKVGIKVLAPQGADQAEVMGAVNDVKGNNLDWARKIALLQGDKLAQRGAEAIIAGCTEIPLILKEGDLSVPVVDATMILARQAVKSAKARA